MRRASDCWTTVCCRDITHDTMHVADAASGSIDLSIAAASTRSRDDRIPTDEMNASDINRANDLSLSLSYALLSISLSAADWHILTQARSQLWGRGPTNGILSPPHNMRAVPVPWKLKFVSFPPVTFPPLEVCTPTQSVLATGPVQTHWLFTIGTP